MQAQQYKTALGVRLISGIGGAGHGGAFTIKHFVNQSTALDGILEASVSTNGNDTWFSSSVTGLYEPHKNFFTGLTSNLTWYWGIGATVGFSSHRYWNGYDLGGNNIYETNTGITVGPKAAIGAEFTLPNHPWTFSVDALPGFVYVPGWESPYYSTFTHTVSAKYIIGYSKPKNN
jgi:hypothetical protein